MTDPANPNVRYSLYLVDYHGGWFLGTLAMCSRAVKIHKGPTVIGYCWIRYSLFATFQCVAR